MTPWPFLLVEHTDDFKPRGAGPHDPPVPIDILQSTYLSMNPEIIMNFEKDHINALMLSCMVEAETQEQAVGSILSCFPDAVIVRCLPIPLAMIDDVRKSFEKDWRWREPSANR